MDFEFFNEDFQSEVLDQRDPINSGNSFIGEVNSPNTISSLRTKKKKTKHEKIANSSKDQPVALDSFDVEKINLVNNLVHVNFLEKGATIARSVGRILVSSGGAGTGTMISPDLMLTNNHVVGSQVEATGSIAEFNFERDVKGNQKVTERRKVLELVATNKRLDYSVLRLASSPGTEFGFVDITTPAIPVPSHPINGYPIIIQHPNAGLKQVALTDNHILNSNEHLFHYTTDTNPGSSGSLVFNHNWIPLGLHHAGRITGIDNSGRRRAVNEGILLTEIVADMEARGVLQSIDEVFRVMEPILQNPLALPNPQRPIDPAWYDSTGLTNAIVSMVGENVELVPLAVAAAGVAAGAGAAHWAHVTSKEDFNNNEINVTLKFTTNAETVSNDASLEFIMSQNSTAFEAFRYFFPVLKSQRCHNYLRQVIYSADEVDMNIGTEALPLLAGVFLTGVGAGASAYSAGK